MRVATLRFYKGLSKSNLQQEGASLIELMVAVFIFAVGVLGFASLQSHSIQATFDNSQRDQVVWMTESLVDRIRLNAGAATAYQTALTPSYDITDCDGVTPPAPQCDTAVCTADQMAAFDVWDLYCRNTYQGVNAIKGFSATLLCTDSDETDGVCDAGTDMRISNTWCARTVETTESATDAGTTCNKTIAQMSYNMEFMP